MPPFITLDGLSFRAPDGRTLFDNLTLSFGAERTGVVGANGYGKTTLLRLILRELSPLSGSVSTRGRVDVLRQSHAPPATAIVADLLEVGADLDRLARIDRGEGSNADVDLAVWDLSARIETALLEVGLTGVDLDRPAASLSGGEATRAALARLLIARPDVILLDEPTNNLDRAARRTVAAVLEGWRGGAVVVSHDRGLLRGVDRIIELSDLGARIYGGNWDLYAERRAQEADAARRDLDEATREARKADREIQAARERQDRREGGGKRAKARGDIPKIVLNARAGKAEATRGRLELLGDRKRSDSAEALEAARANVSRLRKLGFELPPCGLAAAKLVLSLESVGFGWPGSPSLFRNINLRLLGPARMAISGANGSGKTSLLRLITGELEPTAGRITRGATPVVLDQRAALLRDDLSLVENYRLHNPDANDNQAHAALARFLFRNVAALRRAGELSGGERLRAGLACLLQAARPPRFIILDEPTNHLDIASIEAIEAALAAYDGALLVVSHDEDFLDAVGVTERLAMGSHAGQGSD